ncbi:MAG TPA: cytochrome c oxidase assembly protein [Puia sp.]|nr:cytochrome c oxidase assembly protein [Puia sp.]
MMQPIEDPKRVKSVFCLAAACLLLLASCSMPYWPMSDHPVSLHMVVHIMLFLICGPLFVIGLPARWHRPWLLRLSRFLFTHRWLAWLGGTAIMWIWHVPVFYNASMAMHGFLLFSFFHQVSLVAGGMLFCWPLFAPYPLYRIHPLGGILYLATSCISCSLMGLLIAFTPQHVYRHSGQEDLQTAGLIMWVPGCIIYLSGCLYLFWLWLRKEKEDIAIISPINKYQ